jgi:GNAT superfamily N-acetyltransferase
MDIEIRRANKYDVNDILEITKRIVTNMINVNKINQWDYSYPNQEVFTKDIEQGNLFVATNIDVIVGFICINNEETDEYKKVQWRAMEDYLLIHRIGVDPLKLGIGIGTKLIAHAEMIAEERGAKWMKIDTNSSNLLMNNLIKKSGYQYVGEMQLKPNKPIWYAYDKKIK